MLPIPISDENPAPGRHEAVVGLIAANIAGMFLRRPLAWGAFAFIPVEDGRPWTWLSYQFLHADAVHLLGNMWMLWLFGDNLSARLKGWFIPFYLAGGAVAAGGHLLSDPASAYPMIGASGSVCAVMGAYAALWPQARLRCVSFYRSRYRRQGTRHHSQHFTISALIYIVLYLFWQMLSYGRSEDGAGIAYAAHIGGLAFGAAVGVLLHAPAADGGGFSGAAGQAPEGAPTSKHAAAQIAAHLAAGAVGPAADAYAAAVRADPGFQLPPESEIRIADIMARRGHAHLARHSAEALLTRHEDHPAAAHAKNLLGWLAATHYRDFELAARSFREAMEHPAADAALKADAAARLAQIDPHLKKTFVEAPAEDGFHSILLEGSRLPTPAQTAVIARLLGDPVESVARRLQNAPGFIARCVKTQEAARLAEELESGGVPVVAVAEDKLWTLPKPLRVLAAAGSEEGAVLTNALGSFVVPWPRLLLIAGFAAGIEQTREREMGLMEVSVPGRQNDKYERRKVSLPVIEILAQGPAERWRWLPPDPLMEEGAMRAQFFDALQSLVSAAPGVPVDRGAQAAFNRRLPEDLIFPDEAAAETYLDWQAQLAGVRKV